MSKAFPVKPDVSRRARVRRKPNALCCICQAEARLKGQRQGKVCHAIEMRFWRAKEKVKNRTLDDDVRMVRAGMELLQRRLAKELGIPLAGALRRAA